MQRKRGISLIVLVITIIVMIILAGAIILTLNNTGIIGKASEATDLSNKTNLKQIGNVYLGEYIIKTTNGEIDKNTINSSKYVKDRMVESGIDASIVATVAVTEEGEVLVGLTPVAAKLIDARVPMGAPVAGYDVSSNATTHTTTGIENSFVDTWNETTENQPQTVNRMTAPTWTYMGVSDDGEALIVMDIPNPETTTTPTMALGGTRGYLHGVEALNEACDVLYSTNKGEARSINYEDVLKVLKYTGNEASYTTDEGTKYLPKALTIGQIEDKYGLTISTHRYTLLADDFDSVLVNNNFIDDETTEGINADRTSRDIIFIDYDVNYWIASRSVNASYRTADKSVTYRIRRGNDRNISSHQLRDSYEKNNFWKRDNALRPVIELADELEFTYASGVLTLK